MRIAKKGEFVVWSFFTDNPNEFNSLIGDFDIVKDIVKAKSMSEAARKFPELMKKKDPERYAYCAAHISVITKAGHHYLFDKAGRKVE